jgi:NAD(P)-dependent dehydrogenase (short-subunit alcohol dehydrogenase family)
MKLGLRNRPVLVTAGAGKIGRAIATASERRVPGSR